MNSQKLQGSKNRDSCSGDAFAPGINFNSQQGALRDSCQRAEAILLASPLPIVTLDLQGTVRSWNPAAEEMFGWNLEDVLGNPLPVVPQEEEVRYQHTREILMRGKAQTGNSVSLRKRDGSRVHSILSTAPLFDEAGRMSGSVHMFQAIGGKNPDSRMIGDLKMEATERLARVIAHEFNNSIGAILGWAEMALDGLDPRSPLRKPLDHILKEARHASDVTRDLAVFSQHQDMEMYEVDLNHVVEQALDQSVCSLPPGIVAEKALTPNLPRILADPEQIARVLMELCLLSKEGMPSAALRIETGQTRIDQDFCRELAGATPGNYAVLRISHRSLRMETETLCRLFDPFSTAAHDPIGSGLGLAVAYGIVKQHGGFINASSVPDQGTHLQVYLPVIASNAESAR